MVASGDRYKIHELIGEGGMSEVFRATHTQLDREVAIKLIRAELMDDYAIERFKQEARAVAKLTHPHILQVYDFDVREDGRYFMAMEYLQHGDVQQHLKEYLNSKKPLPLLDALLIIKAAAQGLHYAHEAGLVHRDVKLSNIFITKDGRVVVGDFGVAIVLEGQKKASGALVGTPLTLSPEQIQGSDVDRRADIYSLGVVFFQLTTGQAPFMGDSFSQIINHHLYTPAPDPLDLNPSLPYRISTIIQQMLAKNPDDRPADMLEVVDVIDEILASQPTDSQTTFVLSDMQRRFLTTTTGQFNVRGRAKNRIGFLQWIALVALILVGLAYFLFRPTDKELSATAAVMPASEDEYLILIAPMRDEETNINISDLLSEQLSTGLISRLLGENLRIEILEDPVMSEEQAQAIGEAANADEMIWGRRDASGWRVIVDAPRYSADSLRRLQAEILQQDNYGLILTESLPELIEYYCRVLLITRLIEDDDILTVFLINFNSEALDESLRSLAATSVDEQVIDITLVLGSNNAVDGDKIITDLLEIFPNDLSLYYLRWGVNVLSERQEAAELDVETLLTLTDQRASSRGIRVVTAYLFGDEEFLAQQFGQASFAADPASRFANTMIYDIALSEGHFSEVFTAILNYQAWLEAQGVTDWQTSHLTQLMFLYTLQGNDAKIDELERVSLEYRQTYFYQETNRFFREINPRLFPPMAFFSTAFGDEMVNQLVAARISYNFGSNLHPDYYILNWRLAHFEEQDHNYQSAYDRFEKAVVNAPVAFPIARYEQALLVREHKQELENPRTECDLLMEAYRMAEETDPRFYKMLLEKIQDAQSDCE